MTGRRWHGLLSAAAITGGVMLPSVASAQPGGDARDAQASPNPGVSDGGAPDASTPGPASEVELPKDALALQKERFQAAIKAATEARQVAEEAREAGR